MSRSYKIEGTREYLYWAIGLLLLALWCIRDGWFPSMGTLTRHPLDNEADSFYIFNKSLALLSLAGSAVCSVIHRFVK